jgi:hypothetical protein
LVYQLVNNSHLPKFLKFIGSCPAYPC